MFHCVLLAFNFRSSFPSILKCMVIEAPWHIAICPLTYFYDNLLLHLSILIDFSLLIIDKENILSSMQR